MNKLLRSVIMLAAAGACFAASAPAFSHDRYLERSARVRESVEVSNMFLFNTTTPVAGGAVLVRDFRNRVVTATVTSGALGSVYLDQRRMLELGRRGGARARVDSVEVARVEGVEPTEGGFKARVAWEAGGFVVHYGHRHFRLNRYEADVELVPDEGAWRIARLEVRDKQRTR